MQKVQMKCWKAKRLRAWIVFHYIRLLKSITIIIELHSFRFNTQSLLSSLNHSILQNLGMHKKHCNSASQRSLAARKMLATIPLWGFSTSFVVHRKLDFEVLILKRLQFSKIFSCEIIKQCLNKNELDLYRCEKPFKIREFVIFEDQICQSSTLSRINKVID